MRQIGVGALFVLAALGVACSGSTEHPSATPSVTPTAQTGAAVMLSPTATTTVTAKPTSVVTTTPALTATAEPVVVTTAEPTAAPTTEAGTPNATAAPPATATATIPAPTADATAAPTASPTPPAADPLFTLGAIASQLFGMQDTRFEIFEGFNASTLSASDAEAQSSAAHADFLAYWQGIANLADLDMGDDPSCQQAYDGYRLVVPLFVEHLGQLEAFFAGWPGGSSQTYLESWANAKAHWAIADRHHLSCRGG